MVFEGHSAVVLLLLGLGDVVRLYAEYPGPGKNRELASEVLPQWMNLATSGMVPACQDSSLR